MNKINNYISKIKKSDSKTQSLIKNISISFILKGLSIVLNLLLMPLYISFFNDDIILGVWFTIMSILNYICSFDIGIGNGVRNLLVEPIEKNDKSRIKIIISTSYISMFIIGLIIIIIFFLLFNVIPWLKVFNITSIGVDYNTIKIMILLIFIGVIIHFFLNLINSINYAMQKSFVPSFILNMTNLIVIIGLYIYKYLTVTNKIIYVSILNIVSITIPYLIFTIVIFCKDLRGCFVSIKCFKFECFKKIIGLGGKFLYLQILSLLFFSVNEYLISIFTSPENVVVFQVYNKIFYAISALFSMMLTPLWSAVKKAKVQSDNKWINAIYRKINLLWISSIPVLLIIVLLYKYIINIWLGNNITFSISYTHLLIFAGYYFLYMKVCIISNFLSGMEKLRATTIVMSMVCVLKIVSLLILFKYVNSWIYVILVSAILIVPYILFGERDIKKELLNNK